MTRMVKYTFISCATVCMLGSFSAQLSAHNAR